MTYFDVLPVDVTEIILLNLPVEELVTFKHIFPFINDNKFWYKKINYDFLLINMDLLACQFYNYKNMSKTYIIFEYSKLKSSCEFVSGVLKRFQYNIQLYIKKKKEDEDVAPSNYQKEYIYSFDCINNFNVLAMEDKVSPTDIQKTLEKNTTTNVLISLIFDVVKNKFIVTFQTIEYKRYKDICKYEISLIEFFNIFLHIKLNGGQ